MAIKASITLIYLYVIIHDVCPFVIVHLILVDICTGLINHTLRSYCLAAMRVTANEVFTADGIRDRPDVPNIVILITDGVPTRDEHLLETETQQLKDAGVHIIGIGISSAVRLISIINIIINMMLY